MAKEVSVGTGLAIYSATDAENTTPLGFRRMLALLFRQSEPLVPIPGRLGADHLVVTLRSDMKYKVSSGGAVTIHDDTKGAYLVGSISDVIIDTDPASGTNPRYDRIFIVQPDPQYSETGVARIGVVCGTPAASPVLPDLPIGALELGRKLIAPTATGTNAGAVLTDIPMVTGLNRSDISANEPAMFVGRFRRSDGALLVNGGGSTLMKWQSIEKNTITGATTGQGVNGAFVSLPPGVFRVTMSVAVNAPNQTYFQYAPAITGATVVDRSGMETHSPAGFNEPWATMTLHVVSSATVAIPLNANQDTFMRLDGYVRIHRV